jgi:triosephosphate isomerase
MNTTITEGVEIIQELKNEIKDDQIKVAICPPFTHLDKFKKVLKGSFIKIGAQNVHEADKGAFTGEISIPILKELMVDICIIGHSERRLYFGETDELVNKKAIKLLENDIVPILCVGEPLEVRLKGMEKDYVKNQITKAFEGISKKDAIKIKIAYEPIWAIGTGDTATPEDAEAMCLYIREIINSLDYEGEEIAILYGGSVNDKNIKSLIAQHDIDGALVGGASLNKNEFINIINGCR